MVLFRMLPGENVLFVGDNSLLFLGENVLLLLLGENVLVFLMGENVLLLFLGEKVLLGDENVLWGENSMGVFRPKLTPLSSLSMPEVLCSCRVLWLKN